MNNFKKKLIAELDKHETLHAPLNCYCQEDDRCNSHKRLKDFVLSALDRYAEEIAREVEGMRKEPTLCGNCDFNGELCKECYANRRANTALTDVLAIIRKGNQA